MGWVSLRVLNPQMSTGVNRVTRINENVDRLNREGAIGSSPFFWIGKFAGLFPFKAFDLDVYEQAVTNMTTSSRGERVPAPSYYHYLQQK
jgi:hypothetical protein